MSVEWWYPVLAWGAIMATAGRRVLAVAGAAGLYPGPIWLPCAIGAVTMLPLSGLPLGRWLHGASGNFSIPFVILLLDDVLSPLLPRPLLDDPSRQAGRWFGVTAAMLLYPMALGLGPFDPYALGWQTPVAHGLIAIVAALLSGIGNRFGAVMIAAGIAWHLGILESDNAWDYLVDPAYGCIAALSLVANGVGTVFTRRTRRDSRSEPARSKDSTETLPSAHRRRCRNSHSSRSLSR